MQAPSCFGNSVMQALSVVELSNANNFGKYGRKSYLHLHHSKQLRTRRPGAKFVSLKKETRYVSGKNSLENNCVSIPAASGSCAAPASGRMVPLPISGENAAPSWVQAAGASPESFATSGALIDVGSSGKATSESDAIHNRPGF